MNKETEIKLCLSQDALSRVREHPLLAKRNKSGWVKVELANQYFDTPKGDLAAAHVALRIRRDGDDLIQTLKSRGASVAGLSERNEWDWPLEKAKLDLKKLDDSCWPQALAELDKKQLKAVFSTDFVREKADIAWGRGKSRVVIEAALDLGTVKAGKLKAPLCELELELKEGEVGALLELAQALAADIPVLPCDISKAERGYRLSDTRARADLALPEVDALAPLDANIPALVGYLLASSQRLAEQYVHTGHWRVLGEWFASLTDLRALLSSLGQAAPRASTHALREYLDGLIGHWRAFVHAGHHDEALRQQAPERFAQELSQTRWGQFSLSCAKWLYDKHWMAERNARGSRQGAALLGNWLAHLLTDEALALQLKRYQQQPEDLAEQLPRIEKMLVWLRLARTALIEVPEVDRFYGELRELQELALEPISDELLEARVAQAHTVWTLKAYKALTR